MKGDVAGDSLLDAALRQSLAALRAQNLYRVRRVVEGPHAAALRVDGQPCINFCSNDYLGLAADPRLADAARRALADGVGAGASALVSGYNREHAALEEALADWLQRPRALLFSSGWAANLGVLKALLGKDDVLLADELNHASLIDGGRLCGARYQRIAHGDAAGFEAAAEAAAREYPAARRLIVTDSVFSMDGDRAPLAALQASAQRHGASLMVDDAHGFGVLGGGRGALFETTAPMVADVLMAGFGKALGTAGAAVAGSEMLIEWLIQRARTWVFSTAPPPPLAAASRAALAIVRSDEGAERRDRLRALIARFRSGCAQLGIPVSASTTAIQPLVLGAEDRALAVSRRLLERGFWVAAIRPPTVPVGTARLRITLTAAHRETEIDGLLEALATALAS
jgi:8-amino-7-oxononanoate synthase